MVKVKVGLLCTVKMARKLNCSETVLPFLFLFACFCLLVFVLLFLLLNSLKKVKFKQIYIAEKLQLQPQHSTPCLQLPVKLKVVRAPTRIGRTLAVAACIGRGMLKRVMQEQGL